MKLFAYLSPKICPLFPEPQGDTVFASFVQRALDTRAEDKKFTGKIGVAITTYCEGNVVERFDHEVKVTDGVADRDVIWCEAHTPGIGYAEIALKADRPLFFKIWPETGYSLFSGTDGRCVTIVYDKKYANYLIVQQIKTWNTFCLLHTAAYVDPVRDCGNSMLLINPYESPILVELRGEKDEKLRVRVPSKSAKMADLGSVTTPGKFSTVMLTGNNRIIAYDVRHRYGDAMTFNTIDHLDTFNGLATRYPISFKDRVRQIAREGARRVGLRYV